MDLRFGADCRRAPHPASAPPAFPARRPRHLRPPALQPRSAATAGGRRAGPGLPSQPSRRPSPDPPLGSRSRPVLIVLHRRTRRGTPIASAQTLSLHPATNARMAASERLRGMGPVNALSAARWHPGSSPEQLGAAGRARGPGRVPRAPGPAGPGRQRRSAECSPPALLTEKLKRVSVPFPGLRTNRKPNISPEPFASSPGKHLAGLISRAAS